MLKMCNFLVTHADQTRAAVKRKNKDKKKKHDINTK